MRSNSLDIKLKKTEEELKQHEQEIVDQHELHELTVKELELTKTSHKIALEEILQRKQKVRFIINSIVLFRLTPLYHHSSPISAAMSSLSPSFHLVSLFPDETAVVQGLLVRPLNLNDPTSHSLQNLQLFHGLRHPKLFS